jgi:hypothetical protein
VSQYSFTECTHTHFNDGVTTCTQTRQFTVDVAPLTPPFLYNYQVP